MHRARMHIIRRFNLHNMDTNAQKVNNLKWVPLYLLKNKKHS